MFLPETYLAALCLMILTMLCWGSWANTLKLCPGIDFSFSIGITPSAWQGGAIFWGLTAGSMGHAGLPLVSDVARMGLGPMLYAFCGGVVFNVANLLLVAAIDVAGLAVAFPVGIGLALVIGAVSNYVITPGRQSPAAVWRSGAGGCGHCAGRGGLPQARGHGQSNDDAGHCDQPRGGVLMGCFYPLCGAGAQGNAGRARARSLRGFALLRAGVVDLNRAGKPAADEEAAGRKAPCRRRRLLARAAGLASGRQCWAA